MSKKAQGISINVIIIAAIALLVLVILAVLILRSGGQINTGTGCKSVNGICMSAGAPCESGYTEYLAQSGKRGGCEENAKCCVSVS
jgi:hypothetical protein